MLTNGACPHRVQFVAVNHHGGLTQGLNDEQPSRGHETSPAPSGHCKEYPFQRSMCPVFVQLPCNPLHQMALDCRSQEEPIWRDAQQILTVLDDMITQVDLLSCLSQDILDTQHSVLVRGMLDEDTITMLKDHFSLEQDHANLVAGVR